MSRKDAWQPEQIDALFAVFDSVSPKELNEKMRPGARVGDFMEQACMAVFGQVESKLMTRVRSRVARIKRDFLDYLLLLRDKERNPSLNEGEEYSKKLALLYQRLPRSLIGLEVTFDLKEGEYESGDEVAKKNPTPPVIKPKPIFRVPVDKAKIGDQRTPPKDDEVPLDTLKNKYKLDGYGGGATVEKVSENAPPTTTSIPDKSIHIGEDDILSGPKNQRSAEEGLRREELEASKEKELRRRIQNARKRYPAAMSLFDSEDGDDDLDLRLREKKPAASTKPQPLVAAVPKPPNRRSLPGPSFDGSDSDPDFGSHVEMLSLASSTPKAPKRYGSVHESSPIKRSRSSQVLNLSSDDDDPIFVLLNQSRQSAPGTVSMSIGASSQNQSHHPFSGPSDSPKRKRGRPRKDASAATTAAPSVNFSMKGPPKKKLSPPFTVANATSSGQSFAASQSSAPASVESKHLPQYFEAMDKFLQSVERLYILADGDAGMKQALSKLVQATTEKIEKSVAGSGETS
ncbi:hypothetical protein CJU90_4120 [Yarrowia sp. C11]|nr:hypothetical protein CKK34_5729 [Yarrowia sp. E02]KAG5367811.1 hypothetical protein CJU90_4120 [Yarrowia sp. C11]